MWKRISSQLIYAEWIFGAIGQKEGSGGCRNTEKSSGALIPSATVIVAANSRSKSPLKKAVVRVCHPSTSRIPKRVSAQVATMARVGTAALGKNQSSVPV
jgi:hypothetical protein